MATPPDDDPTPLTLWYLADLYDGRAGGPGLAALADVLEVSDRQLRRYLSAVNGLDLGQEVALMNAHPRYSPEASRAEAIRRYVHRRAHGRTPLRPSPATPAELDVRLEALMARLGRPAVGAGTREASEPSGD